MTGYNGVVMLHHPPLDKIAAIGLLESIQEKPISEILFHGHPECPLEQIFRWEESGYFPIDIGEENYRQLGVGSATEAVVAKLELSANLSAGSRKLIDILARHNTGKNNLKGHQLSLAKLVRKAYDLPGVGEVDLINRLKDVVLVFITDEDRRASGEPPAREDCQMVATLPELVEATAACQFAPFTIGRYLRDMWRLGLPVDELCEKVSYWLKAWEAYQDQVAQANIDWPKADKIKFVIAGSFTGAAIETSNRILAEVGAPTVDILICRDVNTGQTAILTKRLDLSALASVLTRLEPGLWYNNRKAGQILNGGPLYPDLEATKLFEQLVGLIQANPPLRPPPPARRRTWG